MRSCFNINSVIADVVNECTPSIASNQVQLINRAIGQYPLLYGDAERTRRVVYNLVTNAIKYTERGSICIEAWVEGMLSALVLPIRVLA